MKTRSVEKDGVKGQQPKPAVGHPTAAFAPAAPAQSLQRASADPRSLTSHDVIQLQRTIGNRATAQLLQHKPKTDFRQLISRDSARESRRSMLIQRAGDPKGLMISHGDGPIPQTNHHIIPENKIAKFWQMLTTMKHFRQRELRLGLKAMVGRGYAQLDMTIPHNAMLVLRKVWDEIPEAAYTPQEIQGLVAAIKTSAVAVRQYLQQVIPQVIARPEVPKKFAPGDSEYQTAVDKLQPLSGATSGDEGRDVDKRSVEVALSSGFKHGKDTGDEYSVVEQMLRWMPGNIHVGPKNRLDPEQKDVFDKEVDDGGKTFEVAAKQVIPPQQFELLNWINGYIDAYLKYKQESTLKYIGIHLTKLTEFQVTPYLPANWEPAANTLPPGKAAKYPGKWRLKNKQL